MARSEHEKPYQGEDKKLPRGGNKMINNGKSQVPGAYRLTMTALKYWKTYGC
jgi:hypothetical protein